MAARPPALPEGTKVGSFRVTGVLGYGGFGVTYKATDESDRRQVAIKEYFPHSAAVRNEQGDVEVSNEKAEEIFRWGLKRFVEEAETVLRFNHPNIVRVEQIFGQHGTAYSVLEFIEGDSLQKWLVQAGGSPDQHSLDVFLEALLDALTLVHLNDILHRDIAPKNILLRGDGAPVLIDFGSARQLVCAQTMSMTALITPHYAPYEQYLTSGQGQGPWTDIYAVAATVYELLTGQLPPEAPGRILGIDQYVPAKEAARGNFRPSFLAAIDWGLQCRREHRPQSVDEWRRGLFADTGHS